MVSKCPNNYEELLQRSIIKCIDVCGRGFDEDCKYHCMRDSTKSTLVEFCAKPKILFDYCPEYDPVDQTIQKDFNTLCESNFSRNYFESSEIFFCNPDRCLQLYEKSDRSGGTTLTTLMTETTEMDSGDFQDHDWSFNNWFLILLVVVAIVLLTGCIIYSYRRGYFRATYHKLKKRNSNDEEN